MNILEVNILVVGYASNEDARAKYKSACLERYQKTIEDCAGEVMGIGNVNRLAE